MSEERIVRRSASDRTVGKTDWARVDALTDEEIDEAARSDPDAQPTDSEFWKNANVVIPKSKFGDYLRVDHDIVEWFKSKGKGYQTRMNKALRAYMESQRSEE